MKTNTTNTTIDTINTASYKSGFITVLPIYIFLLCSFITIHFSLIFTPNTPSTQPNTQPNTLLHMYVFIMAMGWSMIECLTHLMVCHICHIEYHIHTRVLWMMVPLALCSVCNYYNYMDMGSGSGIGLTLELVYLYVYAIIAMSYTINHIYMVSIE